MAEKNLKFPINNFLAAVTTFEADYTWGFRNKTAAFYDLQFRKHGSIL